MTTSRPTLPRKCRLAHDREFQRVYAAKMKKIRGPLILFTCPNNLPHARLGLAISRRIGGATVRTRIKRLLREAFRLLRHELPASATGSYDFVVSVRSSEGVSVALFGELLRELAALSHHDWQRRASRRPAVASGPDESRKETP